MPIVAWILFGFIAVIIAVVGICIFVTAHNVESKIGMVITGLITIGLILGIFGVMNWYYTSTESGKRAVVDQQSDFGGGLDRTINIYTADGEIIATYTGKIDIENKEGGYLLFDYDGKRYTYYNCFVESIAEIE